MKVKTMLGVAGALSIIIILFGSNAAFATDLPTGDIYDVYAIEESNSSRPYVSNALQNWEQNPIPTTESDALDFLFTIMPTESTVSSADNEVMLTGNMPAGASININNVDNSIFNSSIDENPLIWAGDISLSAGGVKLSPGAGAQLSIFVGSNYNGAPLKLIHLKDNGLVEEITTVVRNGYLTANTDSLSPFGIVATNSSTDEMIFPWSTSKPEPSEQTNVSSESPKPTIQPTKPAETQEPTATSKPTQSAQAVQTQVTTQQKPSETETPKKSQSSETQSSATPQTSVSDSTKKENKTEPQSSVANHTSNPVKQQDSEEKTKVTITDVPKTDDTTNSVVPYVLFSFIAITAIIFSIKVLIKPNNPKKKSRYIKI